ncbi:acyltransferase [Clostridium sp. 1001271B_151109_B4]|uniref:acyltransferase n=1 Tax=Clostridium sp. 1001271B_151109_B4 TaxID=2787148 RepID=UPI0018AA957A|nr:acyltransferase [Clostridium sp. 1001271B_151109_B4]
MKDKSIQCLRALSILAVVLIHSLPNADSSIYVRQFINFCVAMFIFISGYLTDINIDDTKKFYKKRILRVIFPYLIWSAIFIVKSKDYNIISIIWRILTGQGCNIYYYIIVYMQLIIVTPLFGKALKSKYSKIPYLLTPISLILIYIYIFIGNPIPFPYNVLSFTVWSLFYYYGLQLKYLNKNLEISLNKNLIMYIIWLILSIIEGILWNKHGNYSMAISQIKISSILCSLYFIKVVMVIKNKIITNKAIIMLGDYSFGVYLTHMFFIDILKKFIPNYSVFFALIIVVIVLLLNCIFIYIGKLILKDKSKYLGFI